ncbi:MAG: TIGR03862 family flavoprotein [Actinobacteria bacterium]|nr:TIGR03862 family flavoprotein [Actinomycetota bacterium]
MQFSAIVVGGGPGGLMAAERLAAAGGLVTLYERTPSVGRKFLLAGRSGLNLTHGEPTDALLERYGSARPRLEAAIRAFDAGALRSWAESLGEPTYVGTSGRIFPESMRANSLLRSWLARLDELGVVIRTSMRFDGWDGDTLRFIDSDDVEMRTTADVVIIALGGGSWPSVGSDGRWVDAVVADGIAVEPLRAANSGFVVDWSPRFVEAHEGKPLKNLVVSCGEAAARGEAVITDSGVEGGVFYAVGAALRDAAARDGSVIATLDLHPDLDHERLVARLAKRRAKDTLSATLKRAGLDDTELALVNEVLRSPAQQDGARIPAPGDVETLARLIKALPLRLLGPEPIERAISTAGGVALDEVDESFMLIKRPGTFVVGEMLDWEAPTGGYLLQATFSTAVAAAEGALAWLANRAKAID